MFKTIEEADNFFKVDVSNFAFTSKVLAPWIGEVVRISKKDSRECIELLNKDFVEQIYGVKDIEKIKKIFKKVTGVDYNELKLNSEYQTLEYLMKNPSKENRAPTAQICIDPKTKLPSKFHEPHCKYMATKLVEGLWDGPDKDLLIEELETQLTISFKAIYNKAVKDNVLEYSLRDFSIMFINYVKVIKDGHDLEKRHELMREFGHKVVKLHDELLYSKAA